MILLATLAAATIVQATPAQWSHSVPVASGNPGTTATYIARPSVKVRQIGMAPGPRPGTMRCVWTADIAVERSLGGNTVRAIASDKRLSGSRHGGCIHNRSEIDREIAGKGLEINAHLVELAARDQQQLRAEVEALALPGGR